MTKVKYYKSDYSDEKIEDNPDAVSVKFKRIITNSQGNINEKGLRKFHVNKSEIPEGTNLSSSGINVYKMSGEIVAYRNFGHSEKLIPITNEDVKEFLEKIEE